MTHFVTLADRRRVPLGAYVAAWKAVKASPAAPFMGAPDAPYRMEICSGAEAHRQFLKGMHARINQHLPRYGWGRKWSPEWQGSIRRLAADLQARAVIRGIHLDLESRLAHRLEESALERYEQSQAKEAAERAQRRRWRRARRNPRPVSTATPQIAPLGGMGVLGFKR